MIAGRFSGLASLPTQPPNGWRGKSRNHVAGRARHNTSSVIAIGSTARHLLGAGDGHPLQTDSAEVPWQNGYAELLIGSIRRECLDHVIVFGEPHLRHVLRSDEQYYNGARTHLSLAKDSPVTRSVQTAGNILPLPILGGLHHHYVRI